MALTAGVKVTDLMSALPKLADNYTKLRDVITPWIGDWTAEKRRVEAAAYASAALAAKHSIMTFSVDDVRGWIATIGTDSAFGAYASNFAAAGVNGAILAALHDMDLDASLDGAGVKNSLHRNVIRSRLREELLLEAVLAGAHSKVERLLQKGVNPDARFHRRTLTLPSTLLIAISNGGPHISIVELLLDHGANCGFHTGAGTSAEPTAMLNPLLMAVANGDLATLQKLLSTKSCRTTVDNGVPSSSNSPFAGLNPLLLAIRNRNKHAVRLLLDAGASATVVDERTGLSALATAVAVESRTIVSLLIANGASCGAPSFAHGGRGRLLISPIAVLESLPPRDFPLVAAAGAEGTQETPLQSIRANLERVCAPSPTLASYLFLLRVTLDGNATAVSVHLASMRQQPLTHFEVSTVNVLATACETHGKDVPLLLSVLEAFYALPPTTSAGWKVWPAQAHVDGLRACFATPSISDDGVEDIAASILLLTECSPEVLSAVKAAATDARRPVHLRNGSNACSLGAPPQPTKQPEAPAAPATWYGRLAQFVGRALPLGLASDSFYAQNVRKGKD